MDKPHKKLIAYQKAMLLVVEVYKITETLPKSEQFGLISQIRRSAVSIPSNIAEGSARKTVKDKNHFYIFARGSLSELDTQLEICRNLNFIREQNLKVIDHLMIECDKLLYGLIKNTEIK